MNLKEFIKTVILDLDAAVSEANSETEREFVLRGVKEQRTALEFDVAVTVESEVNGKAGGEIKVLGLFEVGAGGDMGQKSSTVSRVRFGLHISEETKKERQRRGDEWEAIQNK